MNACSYHARAAAPWHCTTCHKGLCRDCHPGGDSNFGRTGPRCPLCRGRLEWRGTASEAPPFWQVSSQFFAYALRLPALMVMALFVGGAMLAPDGLFGLMIWLLLILIVTRYAMTAIARMAEGNTEPPGPGEMFGGESSHSVQVLSVMLVFGVFAALAEKVSPLFGILVQIAESGILPASVMVLAVTGSVASAVNPLLVFRVIGVIGWSYLVLWLAVTVVTSGPQFLAMLVPESSMATLAPLVFASMFYFLVVAAAMMGYVLYHRSAELGLQESGPQGEDLPADDFLRRTALGHANVFVQERRIDDALSLLREGLQKFPDDLALRERAHQLVLREGADESLAHQTNAYLALLVKTRNAGKAATVWQSVRQRLADFRPEDPEVAVAMAAFLHERSRGKDALPLLMNLHSRAPGFAGLPAAYVLLAKILVEAKNDVPTAQKVLGFVRAKFPADPAAVEAERYAAVIARLAAAPAK